jgi:hypothetical protein
MGGNFYIIHRTNYYGTNIKPNANDKDTDGLEVIWLQVSDRYIGCCPGFGKRVVHLRNKNLEQGRRYRVYLVTEHPGRKGDHYFYKFVVIPEGQRGFGKQSCLHRGWTWEGDIDGTTARGDLRKLLDHYREDGPGDVNHVHVGLAIDVLKSRGPL